MKKHISSRVLSLVLTLALVLGMAVPAVGATDAETAAPASTESLNFEKVDGSVSAKTNAVNGEEAEKMEYALNDVVRVSIVMDEPATLSAGFSSENVSTNASAISYRDSLKANQDAVAAAIAKATGETLDVVWNLTLAANLISANVKYGQIEAIQQVAGVKEVVIENRYEPQTAEASDDPNMATSSFMIGSNVVWANGYTGAGSKIAVIDTGIDPDHQSFSEDGYNYAMGLLAEEAGMTLEEYKASVGVLTMEDVAAVVDQLNVDVTADQTYLSDKVPYAYNYIDENYVVDHDHDDAEEHGSHVEGIAAANRFIPDGEGGFAPALDTVKTQGVAPDAQIVTMKVFGVGGGAYDSDYMVAIEDAIVLGCDSVNLSLGSGNPGFAFSGTYQAIMDSLEESSTVVTMSAGNSGGWNDTPNGNMIPYLYSEDISMATDGSPGSFINSLCVASVDNIGFTGMPLKFGDNLVFYTESSGYTNPPIASALSGDYDFVLFENTGVDGDGNNLLTPYAEAVEGKVAMVYRGASSFYQKMDAAAEAGAIACIVINNQPGTINMDLSDATAEIPCVSITQEDGEMIKAGATPVAGEGADVEYYTGTVSVSDKVESSITASDYYTMSDFSSWGVPGALILKPEITAPGGNIYSVNGLIQGGEAYELMSGTSMASPQVAGMAALVGQYIRENNLTEKTGLTARQLSNSLLMATAEPMWEDYGDGDGYYPVLRQGAGLANVGNATTAKSYILMGEESTASAADGKVKAELGDDPAREGVYEWSFTINNFSDEAVNYSLYTDLFTQDLFAHDGEIYMDTWTGWLNYTESYTVNGEPVKADYSIFVDVNMDGVCDENDVQAILDYAAELDVVIDTEVADLDGDGSVTSSDAYILLTNFRTDYFEVAAGQSAEVTVHVELTEDMKEYLDYLYTGGAYIEGYTFICSDVTDEGEVTDVTYSIPVLGFYGSWTDASMFDNTSVVDVAYGTNTKVPYTGKVLTNGLYLRYSGDNSNYWFLGNPYILEESFPVDRLAVSSDTNLYQFRYNLIRNAAAVGGAVTDENGKVLWTGSVSNNVSGAFYYSNGSSWMNTNTVGYTVNKTVGAMGATEGQKITFGLYAIPEYYANSENGKLTSDEFKAVIESGVLGDGASISYTAVVDDTAPVVTAVSKDLLTGNVTITAQDDNYIAAVMLANAAGTKVYGSALPEQDAPGQTASAEIDLTDVEIGTKALVVVADYAGNEAVYEVQYSSEPVSYDGNMYFFTNADERGSGDRWEQVDVTNLWYDTSTGEGEGLETVSTSPITVTAAEYVNGYVFMATEGAFYVASQGAWDEVAKVGKTDLKIVDMAYSYADETLYAVDAVNNIYTVDTQTGATGLVATVALTNPSTSSSGNASIVSMAIDDEGTFYFTNFGSSKSAFLFKMTLADVVEGAVTLAPINNAADGYMTTDTSIYNYYGTMAWDHDNDKLYMISNYSQNPDDDNRLFVVDTETGKASKACTSAPDTGSSTTRASSLQVSGFGLYIVPSSESVPPVTAPTSVEISETETTLLKGASMTLTADVYPWNLTDKSVTWTSSDPAVATVEDGVVKGLEVGNATITVTTVATPALSATCEVTVEPVPVAKMTGLVYAVDGTPNWSDFSSDAPEAAVALAQGNAYMGGALVGDTIYVVDSDSLYAVDADTFEVTGLGGIDAQWLYADGAAIPEQYQAVFGGKVLAPCNNGTYLEALDPEKGSLSYWNEVDESFENDPMAAIALVGEADYGDDTTALEYLVITENGNLWDFYIYDGEYLDVSKIGSTGLSLGNVSAVTGGVYASMVYDEATGFLFLANYAEGETAQMYAIDPDTCQSALTGTFGEGVWPAVALYQYDRITELTVMLSESQRHMYVGGTATLTVKVKPASYTGGVTWTSDDESVVTVEDGVVTAVGVGTATVTATSVDVNGEGNHVSAACVITVEDRVSVDAVVGAQIVGDAPMYCKIDLNDMSVTEIGEASLGYDAGGMAGGAMYGMYGNFFVIDETTDGFNFATYPNFIAVDMASFPAFSTFATSVLYPSSTNYLVNLDPEAGSISSWNLSAAGMNLCALTFIGSVEDSDGTNLVYLALGSDGALYILYVYESSTAGKLSLSRKQIADLGMEFDFNATSMSYYWDGEEGGVEGAIIADASTMTMYWVDMTAEEVKAGALGTVDASYISSLFGGFDYMESTTPSAAIPAKYHGETKTAIAALPESALVAETVSLSAVNETVGSVNAVSGTVVAKQPVRAAGALAENGVVSLALTEDVDVTNGKVVVTYDPEALTFVSATSAADFHAVNASEGTVVLTYATEEAITAGNAFATLTFSYEGSYVDTSVSVETLERNEDTAVAEDAVVVDILQEDGGHDYQVSDSKDATCTEDGYITYTCSKCGDTYTETVKALGHDYKIANTKAATCTEDGYTGDIVCSACGHTIKGEVIEAKGHQWSEWEVVKEATAAVAGEKQRTCSVCGEVEKEEIPATGSADCPSADFTDVLLDVWYHEAVDFVVENGLMKGTSETTFEPDASMTRGMLVTVLWRYEGSPEAGENTFVDVKDDDYFAKAVAWAAENGVVYGVGDDMFDPNGEITREQMAAILYRYAEKKGLDVSKTAALDVFPDGDTVSEYAAEAMSWAVAEGLITGVKDGSVHYLAPQGNATRAQVATILMRFIENVAK